VTPALLGPGFVTDYLAPWLVAGGAVSDATAASASRAAAAPA